MARVTEEDDATEVSNLQLQKLHPQSLSTTKAESLSLETDASSHTAEQQLEAQPGKYNISSSDATAPVGTVSLLSQPDIV